MPAWVPAVLMLAAACASSDGAPIADSPTARRPPAPVVDSARSLEEDLRRFRAAIPVAPTRLTGGAESREALVRRFVDALTRSDTAALAQMALTRAEFAHLVYPSSPYTRPPYRQSPEIVWLLLVAEHRKGLARLLRRVAGEKLDYFGHRCHPEPVREGKNRLWRGCRVRARLGGDSTRERRLFGAIVERDRHFKFVTYQTAF